ncbi:MAG: acyltransferase domain-containing protein [Burkholderiaceae bacterium]
MTLAVLCSGQGGQHAGMFDLVECDGSAGPLIARANECARFDVVAAVRTTQAPSMFDNAIAQPLICAYQGIVWSLLATAGVSTTYTAGYSVGELTSHAVAGRLSWTDTIALARERAAAMSTAAGPDDGLVAIRGLTRVAVDGLLTGLRAFVAIVNGDDQFIVGGTGEALAALTAAAVSRGAVVQRLPVGIAAHTPLLDAAVVPFREALVKRDWTASIVPAIAGIDGSLVRDASTAIDRLSRQVAETIRWTDCMNTLVERGVTVCLELGPGAALSRMMVERHREVASRSVGEFRSLAAVVEWVARAV